MRAFVYILRCSDGSYYVGSTRGEDMARRLSEHQQGLHDGYTAARLPVTLAWSGEFDRITEAIAFERRLKGWSRAKKEAVIRGEWNRLPGLASRARRPA
ncbi:MAG: GIY-YIG nuclease family protein [Phreatobacter sp.]|jgi:putative endonuclease|uniref:GIY-YIG nuclease family protein n=1 Tax=Phreatobacter sp. TaxID=1966341 RepID=UPI004035C835